MLPVILRTLLGALVIATVTSGAPTAAAHTVLTAGDPAADTTLTVGPARVTATFNEALQPTFAAMTVVGPDGNLWSSGDPEVRGDMVSVAVRPLGPAGRYTVNYRVTSADGHVVVGSWSFTVTAPGTGTPVPEAAAPPSDRIPLWPFVVGAGLLITATAVWGLRRRS